MAPIPRTLSTTVVIKIFVKKLRKDYLLNGCRIAVESPVRVSADFSQW